MVCECVERKASNNNNNNDDDDDEEKKSQANSPKEKRKNEIESERSYMRCDCIYAYTVHMLSRDTSLSHIFVFRAKILTTMDFRFIQK